MKGGFRSTGRDLLSFPSTRSACIPPRAAMLSSFLPSHLWSCVLRVESEITMPVCRTRQSLGENRWSSQCCFWVIVSKPLSQKPREADWVHLFSWFYWITVKCCSAHKDIWLTLGLQQSISEDSWKSCIWLILILVSCSSSSCPDMIHLGQERFLCPERMLPRGKSHASAACGPPLKTVWNCGVSVTGYFMR